MKNNLKVFCVALLVISSCQKQKEIPASTASSPSEIDNLNLKDVKNYIFTLKNKDSVSEAIKLINWDKVQERTTEQGTIWEFSIPGQPTYDHYKQGFRRLVIFRNYPSKIIEGKFQEIIPESIFLQKQFFENHNFSGRIFEYDLNYNLLGGAIISEGKQIGDVKAVTEKDEVITANQQLKQSHSKVKFDGRQMFSRIVETCTWVYTTYTDGEGDFTISGQRICSSYSYEINSFPDFSNMLDGGYSSGGGGGGSYSGSGNGNNTSNQNAIPAPSDLPGENNELVDPKKMMDCFSNITDPAAKCMVKIYVVEPFPGTTFNLGPNSFGHVAISLTKTSGSTSITQTIGYYPTGFGLAKLKSKAQILDNGDLKYDISATYSVSGDNFQKLINYISNPPTEYDFTEFNCSAFVYAAGVASGVPIPNPLTQTGLPGVNGGGFTKTPAGMAAALRDEKITNPNSNVNENGGRIPPSKGECNK